MMSRAGSPVWLGSNEAFITCHRNIFGDYFIYSHYTLSLFGQTLKSEMRIYTSRDGEAWYKSDNGNYFDGHGPFVNISKLVGLAEALGYQEHPIRIQRMLKHWEYGFDYIQLNAPYDKYLFAFEGCLHDPLNAGANWSVLTKRFQLLPEVKLTDNLRLRLADSALAWLDRGNTPDPLIGSFFRADSQFKQHALL